MAEIMIPKPIYPSSLEQHNLFKPSLVQKNTQQICIYSRKGQSMKPSGAFKIFKEKKYNKIKAQAISYATGNENELLQERRRFKLKIRYNVEKGHQDNNYFKQNLELLVRYYDPNTAPLYASNQNIGRQAMESEEDIQKMDRLSLKNQQKIIVQNQLSKIIQITESDQYYQIKEEILKNDDPFIIIKKVDIKKAKLHKKHSKQQTLSNQNKNIGQIFQVQSKISKITSLTSLMMNKNDNLCFTGKPKSPSMITYTETIQHSKTEEMIEQNKNTYTNEKIGKKRPLSCLTDLMDNYNHSNYFLEIQEDVQKETLSLNNIRKRIDLQLIQ